MADSSDPRRVRRSFFDRLADGRSFVELFEHLPAVYFFIKDAGGRFIYINRALRQVMGAGEWSVVGKTDDDFFLPEMAEVYRAEDREVMAAGRTIPSRVWLVPDESGALRWFVSSKSPLLDRSGEAIGVAGAMQDIATTGAVLGPYEQMSDVVRFISERYAEKITVDDMAERAHLSSSQFTRRFSKLFAMTPARYLTRVRINAACQLLKQTDRDLSDIAASTGFHDASHFVKQFKRVMGVTPGEYRAA